MKIPTVILCGLLAAPLLHAQSVEVTIKTLRAQMKYDLAEIVVAPGAKVKLTFQNEDDMPHNIAFCDPGTDVVALAAKMMEKPEEALKRNWEPNDPRVWLHSKTLDPQKTEVLEFTAPAKPADYPYVCTFPGHAMQMRGMLKVAPEGPRVKNLRFALYNGDWAVLPNFNELTPHREGAIDSGLIGLKFDDYKNQYGIVYTGTLTVPKDATYTFYITSDDGSRVLIDGKKVVEYDQIHPATNIRSAKVRLNAGERQFRMEYFQAAGEAKIFAAWEGGGFAKTVLSEWAPKDWEKGGPSDKEKFYGLPLAVSKEPVIYRNFITGGGNRCIGVGYPGGVNIAWNAETMNLALAWRGAFIDAARHWRDRGGGQQPPLGFDAFRPAVLSAPFAVLAEGAEWPALGGNGRAAGYAWRGYRLDAQRVPTFEYEWQGVKVTDRFESTGDAVNGDGKIVRKLKLNGAIPAGAVFRVAASSQIEAQGQNWLVRGGEIAAEIKSENQFQVSVEGARLAGQNLIVPARPEIVVTYSWPTSHAHHTHPTAQ